MIEIVPLLSGDLDIQSAYNYYEECREGLGALFMHRLDEAFGQLRAFPESGPMVHGDYRRLLVPGFPFKPEACRKLAGGASHRTSASQVVPP